MLTSKELPIYLTLFSPEFASTVLRKSEGIKEKKYLSQTIQTSNLPLFYIPVSAP